MGNNLDEESIQQILTVKPHALEIDDVYSFFLSSNKGLKQHQVEKRLSKFGANKLTEKRRFSIVSLLIRQFTDFLIIILLIAGIFSLFINEYLDAAAIFTIVIINGILGFLQEFKAETTVESLKKIEVLKARVIRNGKHKVIPAEELVPGDIILLSEGDKIPADCRIIEAHSMEVDESMLTGESEPTEKQTEKLADQTVLADRSNMVYSGCLVTKGRGIALVVTTGMSTEIGKIAAEINKNEELKTPLQEAMNNVGKKLGILCVIVVIPSLFYGIISGRNIIEMVMITISLAIAAIPEGLPVVVTIALALGIRKMAKKNVLIRRLSSAETLGGIDVICSDKTGTITHNQMTITSLFLPAEGFYAVTGDGYKIYGEITPDDEENEHFGIKGKDSHVDMDAFLENAVLCSDATKESGDPTERAFIIALLKRQKENTLHTSAKRIAEIPFTSAQKFMAVTVNHQNLNRAIIKGAPEVILPMCNLPPAVKEKYAEICERMSEKGLRVLAVAQKSVQSGTEMSEYKNYTFLGMAGMYDPPRNGVEQAIETCHKAGVKVIMVTGDHKKTAIAIAAQIGLPVEHVVTGDEIDNITDTELTKLVINTTVFARVSPPHKVRILQCLQHLGYQVGMTGDGVNDAPAMKRADIGITVGSGTDLAKGIADVILLDDNFATIVKGIKEGRRIFFNIKKFLLFMLSVNFDEIAVVFASLVLHMPLPFTPLQILWLNLATNSLPALALTTEAAENDVMLRKPYKPKSEIFRGITSYAIIAGFVAFLASLIIFSLSYYVFKLPLNHARTITFTLTVFFEFFLVFSIRSTRNAFWADIFSNKYLTGAVAIGVLGQVIIIYQPFMQKVFDTVPLDGKNWLLILSFASSGFIIMEIYKFIKTISSHKKK